MASQLKVDQLAGAAGNTVTVPAGQTLDVLGTLDIDNGTLVLPNTVVTTTGTQTLTNKTLTTPVLTTPIANAGIQLKNAATSAGFLQFFEDSDNGANKVTLIGPASTADVTVTLPAATDTLVGKATTDTLTNKTINGSQLINATVPLAKLANGTDGNIISYDANGAIVAVATVSDGQVLTSTGAGSPPAFEALPASGISTGKAIAMAIVFG